MPDNNIPQAPNSQEEVEEPKKEVFIDTDKDLNFTNNNGLKLNEAFTVNNKRYAII